MSHEHEARLAHWGIDTHVIGIVTAWRGGQTISASAAF
jgi:hypothetical protein